MRKILIIMVLLSFMATPVMAMEITAPEAPDSARDLFPEQHSTFAEDLWSILCNALENLQPAILKSMGLCCGVLAAALLISMISGLVGNTPQVTDFAGTLVIASMLISSSNTLIRLGTETVRQLSDYGKLLIPVMTGAIAAQGGTTTSAALYAGTVLFDSVLTELISRLLVPMIYIYMVLSIAESAIGESLLEKLQQFVKWLTTWSLKTIIYIFTGYIGITGVVSGTVDSAAVKATKLTLSGVVPVVGGILSDASEAVLVSAGVMKNAAGVYGLLSLVAIGAGPFIKIGVQYLLLKATSAFCSTFGTKRISTLVGHYSSAMGLVLGMTGASCLMLMISTVCYMKGVG